MNADRSSGAIARVDLGAEAGFVVPPAVILAVVGAQVTPAVSELPIPSQ